MGRAGFKRTQTRLCEIEAVTFTGRIMRPVNVWIERKLGLLHNSSNTRGDGYAAENGFEYGYCGVVVDNGAGFVCGKLRDYGQGVARQQHAQALS